MQIAILIVASISAISVIVTGYVSLVLRVRKNDDRIRNCDEDLHRWVESEAAELRREKIALVLRGKDSGARPYSMRFRKDQARRQVLRRYEEQLLSAERMVRDAQLSEFGVHRSWRRFHGPMPTLTTPIEKADVIERWKTPVTGPEMSTTEGDIPPEKPIELLDPYRSATEPFPAQDH
jgi:hypothetical protein